MGSACHVAARDKSLPERIGGERSQNSTLYPSSWSFCWDNRRRMVREVENPMHRVPHGPGSIQIKGTLGSERSTFSGGRSHEYFGTPISQKPLNHEEIYSKAKTPTSVQSMTSIYPTEVNIITESSAIVDSSAHNLSFSLPSTFSTPTADHLSSDTYPLLLNSTPSRRARRSPGHQLFRQVSDSQILGLKLPTNNSIAEETPYHAPSNCSNDLTTGSEFGSSDGWSMLTFYELVASSQRERWSFDSEHLGSVHGQRSGSSSRFLSSPSLELQTCGACSKHLTESSLWSGRKTISQNQLAVIAVLGCEHVYHADCLEAVTEDPNRYEPTCPICMGGEMLVSKMSKKASRGEADLKGKNYRISKNRVVDSYLDDGFDGFNHLKNIEEKGKVVRAGGSSSSTTTFAKPSLRRHFSLESKWSRSQSDNDSSRKKGFWGRYRRH